MQLLHACARSSTVAAQLFFRRQQRPAQLLARQHYQEHLLPTMHALRPQAELQAACVAADALEACWGRFSEDERKIEGLDDHLGPSGTADAAAAGAAGGSGAGDRERHAREWEDAESESAACKEGGSGGGSRGGDADAASAASAAELLPAPQQPPESDAAISEDE